MSMKHLVAYTPPVWAAQLRGLPKYKVKLGQLMTPIQSWQSLPGLPNDVHLSIKRDDLTGVELSGNKVRKLEFLLAAALSSGCEHVITCGGLQSNHCRATAHAARQLGLTPHLLLRTQHQSLEEVEFTGNFLLDVMCGAHVYMIEKYSRYETDIKPKMEKIAADIKERGGGESSSYLIPVGGSDAVGVFGYISAFDEMMKQDVLERFDDIVFAAGSGGTAAGLAIANYLTGSKIRLHAICVSDNAQYFHDHINDMLQSLGLNHVTTSTELIRIVDGYKGVGYGVSTQDELDYMEEVCSHTGIITDPTYTGKALIGLLREVTDNRQCFKGNRLLFIHTGGVFGCMDGRLATSASIRHRCKIEFLK